LLWPPISLALMLLSSICAAYLAKVSYNYKAAFLLTLTPIT